MALGPLVVKNGSSARRRTSSGMPPPVSATLQYTRSSRVHVLSVIFPAWVIESAAFETNSVLTQFLESPTANLVSNVGALIFPLSFAYAILRQRLFDVRVIIRRGLQYAMARRFLLAIPMMAAGLLALDLIFHGNQPLFEVLKAHGAVYVAVWALAGLAYQQRNVWLSWLDRRFFRDKYDAQWLFRQVMDDIRHAANVEEVSSSVVTRVVEALHAEFCALLVRKPEEPLYCVVAAAPPGSLTADLPATNKLIPLVRMLGRSVPIMLAESGWLGQQLPQVDKDFLHNARIDLLVPVVLAEGGVRGARERRRGGEGERARDRRREGRDRQAEGRRRQAERFPVVRCGGLLGMPRAPSCSALR